MPVVILALLAYRFRRTGVHNVPRRGPILVVSNHQSYLDPPLIGCGFPRQMSFLARETLFRSRLFGGLIRSVNAIPIDREGMGLAGLKETLRRLKQGAAVLVFPEGTRSTDGEMQPFRPGFTALAVRSRAAILPAAIEGAFRSWPRRQKFPSRSTVQVHFGPPLLPDEFQRQDERALALEVETRVRECQRILRSRPPFTRGRPQL
jgi:1-acyl-sn-glycerol-3-phosphate acyltransferase